MYLRVERNKTKKKNIMKEKVMRATKNTKHWYWPEIMMLNKSDYKTLINDKKSNWLYLSMIYNQVTINAQII